MNCDELLLALREARLMTDFDRHSFEKLVRQKQQNLDCPADDPFLVMSLLDSVYGFDVPDHETATRRCLRDRVLVFNAFHETPLQPGRRRLRAFAAARNPAEDVE